MKNTLFYTANMIDYFRLFLHIISIYTSKFIFVTLHLTSGFLDLIDGSVARAYNQESTLGKCLDMFTDRLSSIIILIRSPIDNFTLLLLAIDIFSHNLFISYHLIKNKHHKDNKNLILRLYHNIFILMPLCFLTEIYYVFLYLSNYYAINTLVNIFRIFYIMKSFFHVVMIYEAVKGLAVEEDTIDKKDE
ncbi:CDP-alcohol phosphatidyltransferase [Spraguea lophii 42_110]|uniref:CDP-alcohol phosphatidyltransferase n=1 Tax=Spraguea lophii (strain 42_110) TaxID=1358809 RepID=S7WC48_SPRLO|nr:CDP-alcohol phosphatidyltransferase [Spraguea lophii 42_110]